MMVSFALTIYANQKVKNVKKKEDSTAVKSLQKSALNLQMPQIASNLCA